MNPTSSTEGPAARTDNPQAPPPLALLQLITAGFAAQAAHVAARLGVADRIAAGVRDTLALAKALDADPATFRRFLATLASLGVLRQNAEDHWELTPMGECLRGDVPGSSRDFARWFGCDAHYAAFGALEDSIRSGQSGFAKIFGESSWSYMARDRETGLCFDRAMSGVAATIHPLILGQYDFTGVDTLVDVGGGQGELLSAILARYPAIRGIVFDLPHVVESARERIAAHGLGKRLEAIGGDFFAAVPPADAYIMTNVLHDWNDADSIAILRNCRAAMRPGGRVLISDFVLRPVNEPDIGRLFDLEMLVLTDGGKERSEAEFANILASSDLRLTRVVPLGGVCLIEARAA
jgi:SAM-dependent methyltransferase